MIRPSSFPEPAAARFAQCVLAAVGLFVAIDQSLVSVLIEPIKHDLRLTDVQVGLANSTSFYLAFAIFCVPMGMLSDRANRVRLLITSLSLWCVGLLLVGGSTTIWPFVAGKLTMGAGYAMTYPAALSLLADFFAPARRPFATATYAVGQALGQAMALSLGGALFGLFTHVVQEHPQAASGWSAWRIVVLCIALLSVILIPFVRVLAEPARQETGTAGGSFHDLWAYRPLLIPLFAAMTCLAAAYSGIVIGWMVPVLTRIYGQQPGDFAVWLGPLILVTGIAGTFAGGRLLQLEVLSGRAFAIKFAGGAALVCCVTAFMGVMPTLLAFAACLAVFNLCYNVAIGVAVIGLNQFMPNRLRGMTMGIYCILIAVAGAVTPPLVAALGQQLGGDRMLGWGMGLATAPFAACAVVLFWLVPVERLSADRTN